MYKSDTKNENYTSFVGSLLVHIIGWGEGALIRGDTYFKFCWWEGRSFQGGAKSRGGGGVGGKKGR